MISFDGTTRGEIERMGRLKDACGGYYEMGRLLREQRELGPQAELRRCSDGRLTYLPMGSEPGTDL